MSEEKKREIGQNLADAIMERPYGFSTGGRQFFLYPVTLGKMYVLQRHIENLKIESKLLTKDVALEALRLAKGQREECLRVIYIHTCRTKEEIFDMRKTIETVSLFDKEMTEEDIAALMILLLSSDRTEQFIKYLGIDKEQKDLRKVMKVKEKSDKNSYSFGGVSVYGSFIAPLMELGMNWDEIIWKRSYTNLRLLIADKVTSITVTDEERKRLKISRDKSRIDAKDVDKLKAFIASESWD